MLSAGGGPLCSACLTVLGGINTLLHGPCSARYLNLLSASSLWRVDAEVDPLERVCELAVEESGVMVRDNDAVVRDSCGSIKPPAFVAWSLFPSCLLICPVDVPESEGGGGA